MPCMTPIDAGLETFDADLNLHWKFVEAIKIFILIVHVFITKGINALILMFFSDC